MAKMPALNELQLDALKEINHIGIEGAASALSKMLGKQVDVTSLNMDIMALADVPDLLSASGPAKAVFLGLYGKILGSTVFLFDNESASKLVSSMTGEPPSGPDFSEMELSAFLEAGNILSGNYLSGMANFFTTEFLPTVPRVINDLQTELVPFVMEAHEHEVSDVVVVTSEFEVKSDNIKGMGVVILTSSAIEILVGELEKMLAAGAITIGGVSMVKLELNDIDRDTLAELGNVGTNAAASALAQMAGSSLTLTVPRVTVCELRDVSRLMGGPEAPVVAFFMNVTGSMDSDALLLFSKDSALMLADMLQGKDLGTTLELEEMDVSAVTEISQIMCGAYMSVVSKFINVELVHGPPHFAQDMAASIVSFAITRMEEKFENALVIDAVIESQDKGKEFRSVFLLLMPPESLKGMLAEARKVLGVG